MTYLTIRRSVFRILDPQQRQTAAERAGNSVIGILILANVTAVILESVEGIRSQFGVGFQRFEAFSVAVFTLEYIARLWTCVEVEHAGSALKRRLTFMFSPMSLVDLAVLVPAFLPGAYFIDLRFARIIRVVRMLRVLKLARYSRTLRTFGRVFDAKRTDIGLMVLFLLVLVVVTSSLMYFTEHEAQPGQFSSIPAAMWWSVATLTTVGYGDIYPITSLGKFLGSIIALIGIGFFALPAGVLAAGFADELAKQRGSAESKICPHCLKELT